MRVRIPSSCSSQTHLSLEIEYKVLQVCSVVDQQKWCVVVDYERYRSETEEVFYGQLVEDQEQDINWEIQQRETLHGGWEKEGRSV